MMRNGHGGLRTGSHLDAVPLWHMRTNERRLEAEDLLATACCRMSETPWPKSRPGEAVMAKRPGKLSRTPTSPLLVPRVAAWRRAAVMTTLCVLAAAWWAGEATHTWVAGEVAPRILSGLAAFFGGSHISPGMRLGGLLLVLLAIYVWWRATRSALGYQPGPVDVQQLVDATSDATPPPVDDLTSHLRMQLSESSLYPPTTVPAEAPPTSFLDLLGDVDLEKFGTAIPRLLGRLRPKLAYRISGVLRAREHGTEPYGITVTLTAYVFSGARATTVWGRDWEQATCRAAYWVVASLLPVTSAGKRPPWRQWWARELPPELLRAYQEAKSLSSRQRYDEALQRYDDALKYDPQNPYIRAEFAGVQEKLELPLDALDTCQRGLTLDGQTADRYNNRLWVRWRLPPRRFRYLCHPRRFQDVLGLRYRNAIILGTSERVVEEWYEIEDEGRSDDERHKMRNDLRRVLVERYWPAAVDFALADEGPRAAAMYDTQHEVERAARKWLDRQLTPTQADEDAQQQVRVVLQRASAQELYRLVQDDLLARLAGCTWLLWLRQLIRLLWPPAYAQGSACSLPSTHVTLVINRDVWAPLRLTWAVSDLEKKREMPIPPPYHAKPHRWCGRAYSRHEQEFSWSATALASEKIEARIRRALRRRIWRPFSWPALEWQDHYNAACVYAVAMNRFPAEVESAGDESSAQLRNYRHQAELAVDQLEKAVLRAESGFTMLERSWMLFEDPDLNLLRRTPVFLNFERTTYPRAPRVDQERPRSTVRHLKDSYVRRLLIDAAHVMEQTWQRRSMNGPVTIEVLSDWLHTEEKAWIYFLKLAHGPHDRWAARANLIQAVQQSDPVATAHAEFPPRMLQDVDAEADDGSLAELLKSMAAALEENEKNSTSKRCHDWYTILDDAIAAGETQMPTYKIRTLCTQYATAWLRLGSRLRLAEDSEAAVKFREAVHRIPEPAPEFVKNPESISIRVSGTQGV
ncbi:Tetratricopeptide repeat-containing protein [Streptomyces sp. 2323.1]|nr:Tetratricopeptide repeat-containing protein [Streptomyces sp. 2323.1]